MPVSTPLYTISWHKPERLLRLTWQAATDHMTDDDFQETLEVFADAALQHHAARLVIDVREFRHRPSSEVLAARDRVTVPKYNEAGAKRQVWIWPGDVSGMKPSSEARRYEERYFSTESDAIAWVTQ